jgi:hypothetical protein
MIALEVFVTLRISVVDSDDSAFTLSFEGDLIGRIRNHSAGSVQDLDRKATSRRSAAMLSLSTDRPIAAGSPVVVTSTVAITFPSFVPTALSVPGSYGTSQDRCRSAVVRGSLARAG